MNAKQLLDRINEILKEAEASPVPIARMHALVARALVEPMTITPPEVQELARAVLFYFPAAESEQVVIATETDSAI